MTSKRKAQIHTLLKGIETGNTEAVSVVNPEKYIQHNPQTHEGGTITVNFRTVHALYTCDVTI
jgi:predicted SnoaL-like aldol condensation-catalyzing enzyme